MPLTRIMYIENKGSYRTDTKLVGPARIGRVTILNRGRSLRYNGRKFSTLRGSGFKWNYMDTDNRDVFWISGCHKDGQDALYSTEVEIDEDVREEYWKKIRNMPENVKISSLRISGKYSK